MNIKVWNVAENEIIACYNGHLGKLLCCQWSGLDPEEVITGGDDFSAHIWKIKDHPVRPGQLDTRKKKRKKFDKLKSETSAAVGSVTMETVPNDDVTGANQDDLEKLLEEKRKELMAAVSSARTEIDSKPTSNDLDGEKQKSDTLMQEEFSLLKRERREFQNRKLTSWGLIVKSKDPDETAQMRRLILNHAGHKDTKHVFSWEKEKQELKSKIIELEEYKTKYENEKKENEILQNRLQELMTGQSDATKNLMRTNESLDRLRIDNKKKIEQIEKLQADIRFKDDRMRNLEIRASEVEKAELILETTKQNLESTIQQVRVRDNEIKRLDKDIDDCNRQLETANSRIRDLEERMEDMKIQVRHEIMKNENIEKNLETIPRLKDTIQEKQDEIQELKRQIEEKNALLAAARKGVREYKDKLRNTEQDIARTEVLKEELQLAQCEVQSLKQLMYGKDYLVTQKTKALDLSKEIIGVLNDNLDSNQVHRIQHLIDRLSEGNSRMQSSRSNGSTPCSSGEMDFRSSSAPPPKAHSSYPNSQHRDKDINVNNHPYGIESDHHGNQQNGFNSNRSHGSKKFLNQVVRDTPDKRKRPVSAMAQPVKKNVAHVHRTTSYREAHKVYTKPLPRKTNSFDIDITLSPRNTATYKSEKQVHSKFKPSLDYGIGPDDENNDNQECESPREKISQDKGPLPSDADSVFSSESDFEEEMTSEQECVLKGVSAHEKDVALSEIINVGDRVLISCPQKPPKYGKKKVLKPINYTGIVKFKGKLHPEKYDARICVGVRMDEPVGDTDGTYRGKRLMYTPGDQGKFYKLRELTSVLNVKTGRYVPVQRLIVHRLHKRSRSDTQTEQ